MIKRTLEVTKSNSNNEYSPFYDPMYTMKITINGQLSLSMLLEKLVDRLDAVPLMANTDGIEVMVHRSKVDRANKIVSSWEKVTGLVMEQVVYQSMYIRDVNNYVAIYDNGKIKHKGAYVYSGLGWHQNHSALVVPMAVEHELLGKGSAEDFIRNHKDMFDFFLSVKVPRSSRLILDIDGEEKLLQNICRYYPSKDGGKLIKIMPPLVEGGEERRSGISTEWNIKPCNNILDFNWDIDYDYYIQETNKLLEPFKKDGKLI